MTVEVGSVAGKREKAPFSDPNDAEVCRDVLIMALNTHYYNFKKNLFIFIYPEPSVMSKGCFLR